MSDVIKAVGLLFVMTFLTLLGIVISALPYAVAIIIAVLMLRGCA